MANFGEGMIEIPLEEFWEFVDKYHDHKYSNLCFGVPKVNKSNQTIEIDYSYNSECNVEDTMGHEQSKPYKQWKNLK